MSELQRQLSRLLAVGLFGAILMANPAARAALIEITLKTKDLTFDEGKPAVVEYTATNPNAFDATVKSVTAINGVNIDGDVHDTAAFLGGPPAFLLKAKQSRDFQLSFNTEPDKNDIENTDTGITKFDIQVVAQFTRDPTDRHCDTNFLCTYTAATLELTVKDVKSGAPEPSTWVMMALGFVGLGAAGYRASRKRAALAA